MFLCLSFVNIYRNQSKVVINVLFPEKKAQVSSTRTRIFNLSGSLDGRVYRWMDVWTLRLLDECKDRWMGGWKNEWMDGWKDGWMEGRIDR